MYESDCFDPLKDLLAELIRLPHGNETLTELIILNGFLENYIARKAVDRNPLKSQIVH